MIAIVGIVLTLPFSGCSSSKSSGDGELEGGASSGSSSTCTGFNCAGDDASDITMTCANGTNFQCMQVNCPTPNTTTTVSGVVYDPAGTNPLWGVAVYVPNVTPGPLPDGVSCADCNTWYTQPVVSTNTDASGHFTLSNVPVGNKIPLVVQVGKWRMEYTLSTVKQCVDNDAASLAGGPLRLPRNHNEGWMPNIAVSTGALDSLECLFTRMGVDPSEYTGNPTASDSGPHIHIFTGGDSPDNAGGAQTQNPTSKESWSNLWDKDADMQQFDLVLLSCEGRETYKIGGGSTVLLNYLNAGGRAFASHYHYEFFINDTNNPNNPFATFNPPLATWTPEGTPGKSETLGPDGDQVTYPTDVVTTTTAGKDFPEGDALKSWLGGVGALTNGQLPVWFARHNADLSPSVNTQSQKWIQVDPSVSSAPNAAEYFSFDMPYASKEQCGRAVYSDLHVSGGIDAVEGSVPPDYPGLPITPDGCASHPLTPQEKALEFMIFDLSSCLTPVGAQQVPPPPK